jgi:hypothetical protein
VERTLRDALERPGLSCLATLRAGVQTRAQLLARPMHAPSRERAWGVHAISQGIHPFPDNGIHPVDDLLREGGAQIQEFFESRRRDELLPACSPSRFRS